MSARQQYVSMVPRNGVGVTLVDAKGNPYATTGDGALVFNRNPILIDPVFEGTSTINRVALGLGTSQLPAVQLGPLDTGLFAPANDQLAVVLNGFTTAQFNPTGLSIIGDLTYSGQLSGAYHSPLTTDGDIYAFLGGIPTRLARGAPGDFLQSTPSGLQWVSILGTGTVTQINTQPGELVGGPITTSGTIGLANTSVSPGVYGNSINVSSFNVDQKGRLTSAGSVPIDVVLALGYAPVNKAGDTMTGPLNGTSSNWTGRLTVTVADGQQAMLLRGATKGVRFIPTAGDFSIEGVDNTGVASYQPLIVGGSEVIVRAQGSIVGSFDGFGLKMTAGTGVFNRSNVSGVNYGGGTAWNSGADMVAYSAAAGGHFQFLRDGSTIATLDGTGLKVEGILRASNYFGPTGAATDAFSVGFGNANGPSMAMWGGSTGGAGAFEFYTAGVSRATLSTAGVFNVNSTITVANAGLLQHDGTHMYVRPTNASSRLFLGANNENVAQVISNGIFPVGDNAKALGDGNSRWLDVWARTMTISGPTGVGRDFIFRTDSNPRWIVTTGPEAESGGNAGSNFAIYGFTDGGGVLNQPFFINRANGYVGLNTATPSSRLHVRGAGSTAAGPSTSVDLGATIHVQDTGMSPGNGGMIMFGAGFGNTAFAAIKGFATDGADNSRGDLVISTRRIATDPTLTETMRVAMDGQVLVATTIPPLSSSAQVATTAWVQALLLTLGVGIPAGTVVDFAGSAAPTGWYICDGSSKTVAGDSALHTAIGYTYGGSGANFNVPDLRGRATAGLDGGTGRLTGFTTLGATGGHQNMMAHTHGAGSLIAANHAHTASGVGLVGNNLSNGTSRAVGTGDGVNSGYFQDVQVTVNGSGNLAVSGTSGSTGAGNAENVQPTMAMNKIIKR